MDAIFCHRYQYNEEDNIEISLHGKKALVCGASQGIGRSIALEFARCGAQVILAARSQAKLEDVKDEISAITPMGPKVEDIIHHTLAVDFSNTEDLHKKVRKLVETLGPIEILVCNAGGPKGGPLLDADLETFEMSFRTHVLANQILVKELAPGMIEKGYGRILNIISTSVKVPIVNLGVSNTIRGAVASWAKSLANELGQFGITVNNILPGFTNTERLETLIKSASDRMGKSEREVAELWKSNVPTKRFAEPSETANAVAFLASPSASYINGVNLPVDGGRTGTL